MRVYSLEGPGEIRTRFEQARARGFTRFVGALPYFKAQRRGQFINVSSVAGHTSSVGGAIYSAQVLGASSGNSCGDARTTRKVTGRSSSRNRLA